MVDFIRLQEIARERLEHDRSLHHIDAAGPTLDAAVSDAAAFLDIPVRRLEYEIVEKGSPGFLGVGKREWRIRAYERTLAPRKKHRESLFSDEEDDLLPVIEDKDGEAFVHFRAGGDVLLKVLAPTGNGRGVSADFAKMAITQRGEAEINDIEVDKAIHDALGAYVKVGTFLHNSLQDGSVSVEIAEGDMKVYVTVIPSEEGGCDVSYETYLDWMKRYGVVHGIKGDLLRNFVDQPIFREKILVAEGTPPIDGRDAYIQYNFEHDQGKVRLREGNNGRVNFRELNIIQNVVEKQPLARKIPPEKGTPGHTAKGISIPAKDGKDIPIPVGTNVHLDTDGETILSDISGQVLVVNGLINVEPVYTVDGDVNLKIGNIDFNGTVIINGNVDDGYSVRAEGNIEVNGSVAKSVLEAKGDIIIHQGINGKGGGSISAGQSFWARFIENANIKAGNMVVASDGIINSYVDAVNRIVCRGKRACIMGGRLRACEEISAKVLGNSTSGTETICEVGYNPKSKEELDKLLIVKTETERQFDEVKLNMQTLINTKKQRKTLSEEKEASLQELTDKFNQYTDELREISASIKKIQDFLNTLKSRSKVSASSKIYPGVKIVIRGTTEEVHTESKAATFVLENGIIKRAPYEELSEEAMRGPDGRTTN